MPERKYPDLAHLPPAEYKKASQKRRDADRKEYHRLKYIKTRDLQRLEERKKELEEAIAIVKAQKEGVASPGKNNFPGSDNDNSGGVETI